MASRYGIQDVITNFNDRYRKLFKERNVQQIQQYTTPSMVHPTVRQISNLNVVDHIWSTGDKLWKLAAIHYKRPDMWWVIAWFNQTPTEAQIEIGDIVNIPLPLEKILDYLEV